MNLINAIKITNNKYNELTDVQLITISSSN